MKKPALLAASLVLVAGTASGCGGGPPTDASTEDFCGAYTDAQNMEALEELDPEAPPEDQAKIVVDALKEQAEKLEEVGTPEDIPDDAREGFEIVLEEVGNLDEDEVAEAIKNEDDEFGNPSDSDKEKTDALEEYVDETC